MLKQYNDRWFLLGAADDDGKILTFALDRIDKVESLPEKKYVPCPDDLSNRFEDIVGVTLYEDRPIEHIVFWASDVSKDYIMTKPIHESQTSIKGETENNLHEKHPQLDGGAFFSIDCIQNYELIRELCSFGKELIVLEPSSIRDEAFKRISMMVDKYLSLRT
jgi:predicted DNA-binding transcriptional regulator YafY